MCLGSGGERACGRPAPIRIPAGSATRDLRPAVDIDAVGVVATFGTAGLIGRAGNNGAVPLRPLPVPANRNAGLTAFERLHLRRIGALAIALVQGRTDRAAQHAAADPGGARGG